MVNLVSRTDFLVLRSEPLTSWPDAESFRMMILLRIAGCSGALITFKGRGMQWCMTYQHFSGAERCLPSHFVLRTVSSFRATAMTIVLVALPSDFSLTMKDWYRPPCAITK